MRKGRGYVPAEQLKKPDHPIGLIPVDALFSPVVRVNYVVEDTRVGQVTDYDRLILDVWTDGSIAPDEAVSLAAKILTEHLRLFTALTEPDETVEILVEKEEEEKDRVFDMTIEELDLGALQLLKRAGINTVEELTKRSRKVRNLGRNPQKSRRNWRPWNIVASGRRIG